MTDTKLAERIEALEGPCREMDWEIFCIHQPKRLKYYEESLARTKAEAEQYGTWNVRMDEIIQSERSLYARRYTASLDAAMTLVPDTTDVTLGRIWCCHRFAHITDGETTWSGNATTEALALCAAALRAQEAHNG